MANRQNVVNSTIDYRGCSMFFIACNPSHLCLYQAIDSQMKWNYRKLDIERLVKYDGCIHHKIYKHLLKPNNSSHRNFKFCKIFPFLFLGNSPAEMNAVSRQQNKWTMQFVMDVSKGKPLGVGLTKKSMMSSGQL